MSARHHESGARRPFAGSMAQLRPLARRVHFLAGILVAPFVLLLCLTGLVYVCSPQIHEDLYGKQLFVHEVAPRSGRWASRSPRRSPRTRKPRCARSCPRPKPTAPLA
ncbi:hypothetical protein BJF90_01955 [Pseudonocardia sp. CNS-004]|nr:hypothetical protein BJF90_01955 [Pseudonocardia sp. CNS-004]